MPRVAFTLLAVMLASAGLAGCGGGESAAPETTETTQTSSPDPGREVLQALVDAAAENDTETMWGLLSARSQQRYGPTLGKFEAGKAEELKTTLAPFAGGKLPVQVSEKIDDRFGLVILSRGRDAHAAILRREGALWRVELPGPLEIDVSGPPPGSKGRFANQIGVEVTGRSGPGTAALYLDGITLFDPEIYSSPESATVFGNLPNGVSSGVHTAAAFATSGDNAAAVAWTFEP